MEKGKKKMKMEGLIPFLIRSMHKKQRPNHDSRRLSVFSSCSTGGGYQLLTRELEGEGESVVNSSHRRTRSEFNPPARFDTTEFHPTVVDSIPMSYSSSSSSIAVTRHVSSNSSY